jgi:hypothetical protein
MAEAEGQESSPFVPVFPKVSILLPGFVLISIKNCIKKIIHENEGIGRISAESLSCICRGGPFRLVLTLFCLALALQCHLEGKMKDLYSDIGVVPSKETLEASFPCRSLPTPPTRRPRASASTSTSKAKAPSLPMCDISACVNYHLMYTYIEGRIPPSRGGYKKTSRTNRPTQLEI